MIRGIVQKDMTKEVCVFEIGGGVDKGKWVVRQFGVGQLGDLIADPKPTEQELKELFVNPDLVVRFEYDVAPMWVHDKLREALKSGRYKPNFEVIISGLKGVK